MKCTCPKCVERIELGLHEVTEEGTFASCPSCKATMTVFAESFGGRAQRKAGEISCASCGNELGPRLYCESCGIPYPRYLVHCLGRKKVSRKAVKFQLESPPFRKASLRGNQFPPLEAALSQNGSDAPPKAGAVMKQPNKTLMAGLAVLLLLVGGFAGFAYYTKWKTETAYLKNFARAAYGVQVGMEMSRKVCQRIAGDWQAGNAAGKSSPPQPSADEERELQAIAAKLDGIKAKCAEEPEKFLSCNQRLVKIEGSYKKLQNLALSPGSSLTGFTDAVRKVEAEYKQATSEFRSGMPAELREELHNASKIYRNLKPLLQ